MDRVAATKARLIELGAVARRARDAGPPCSDCRFKTLLGNCRNPAYAEPRFDAPKGAYEEMFLTSVAVARSDDGLCGPEALLFEHQDIQAIAAHTAWISAKTIWFGAIAMVFVIFLLR